MPDDRKELIAAAAGRLLLRRDGKKLTVTDIVNECHITRQTFYYHFEDIPDLLLWMMKRNLKRNMQEASMQRTPEESLKYLITLSLNSRLFVEKAMHAGYREELERLVMQSFNSLIERILRRWHFPPGCTREQMSLMLRYHLNAVVGLMRSWTEEDSAHPRAVDVQRHGPRQIGDRLFVRPVLQQLAEAEHEHHGACRIEVAADQ